MVDNSLRIKKKLLIKSEAFFIHKIHQDYTQQCLDIDNSADKSRSIRTKQEFQDFLSKYTCFGLFNNNNKLVAYSFFSIVENEAELLDINLLKDLQSKGIGSAFLKELLTNLKDLYNISELILEVAIDNTQAIKSYQKFNFQQIGIRKNYYKNTDGSKTDALVYKILL